jgi:hypothetical protein
MAWLAGSSNLGSVGATDFVAHTRELYLKLEASCRAPLWESRCIFTDTC